MPRSRTLHPRHRSSMRSDEPAQHLIIVGEYMTTQNPGARGFINNFNILSGLQNQGGGKDLAETFNSLILEKGVYYNHK